MEKVLKSIILFVLMILSAVLGELLTASAPPSVFFKPFGFFFITIFYGCGVLLIREAGIRWNLQWSIIFLAIAYGIIEEGIMMQSFFNIAHEDLSTLSNYGMYFGIQLPWTIKLILFHATMSIIIPIKIVDYLFPKYKKISFLGKIGIILTSAGFIFVILFHFIVVVMSNQGMYKEYNPDLFINIVTFLTIIFLIWLAYSFRGNRIKTCSYLFHYSIFGFLGFLFSALNLIFPDVLKALNVSGLITIIMQLFFSGLVILFIIFQIYNEKTSIKHYAFLITGSVFFFILLTPIHEFGNINNQDSTKGMLVVGIVMLFLLLFWMFFVLNNKKNNNNLGTEL